MVSLKPFCLRLKYWLVKVRIIMISAILCQSEKDVVILYHCMSDIAIVRLSSSILAIESLLHWTTGGTSAKRLELVTKGGYLRGL